MAGQHGRTRPQTRMRTPEFRAGDLILFASTGDAVSNLSRWLMRGAHEGPTYAVHIGQFLDPRRVLEMEGAARITTLEALFNRRYWQGPFRSLLPPSAWAQLAAVLNRDYPRYRRHWQGLWKPRGFEVWRCRTLTAEQRQALTREALRYVYVRFGFARLGAHLLDDLICKLLRRDVFLFRHADPADRHPVCSGITAAVYDKAVHYRFGVDPECADPDQIHDWVCAHPDEWVRVFRLEPCPQAQAHKGMHAVAGPDPGSSMKGETTMIANPPPMVSPSRLTSAQVWHELTKASFAVVSYVTPAGAPRSSGVVYKAVGRRLFLAVAPDSWKARHIKASARVAVTVPVRRGGLLSLMLPIPPATISFHAEAIVHPAGAVDVGALGKELAALLPTERRSTACLIELLPEGAFLTYGLGVSLVEMRNPAVARARVPVR